MKRIMYAFWFLVAYGLVQQTRAQNFPYDLEGMKPGMSQAAIRAAAQQAGFTDERPPDDFFMFVRRTSDSRGNRYEEWLKFLVNRPTGPNAGLVSIVEKSSYRAPPVGIDTFLSAVTEKYGRPTSIGRDSANPRMAYYFDEFWRPSPDQSVCSKVSALVLRDFNRNWNDLIPPGEGQTVETPFNQRSSLKCAKLLTITYTQYNQIVTNYGFVLDDYRSALDNELAWRKEQERLQQEREQQNRQLGPKPKL